MRALLLIVAGLYLAAMLVRPRVAASAPQGSGGKAARELDWLAVPRAGDPGRRARLTERRSPPLTYGPGWRGAIPARSLPGTGSRARVEDTLIERQVGVHEAIVGHDAVVQRGSDGCEQCGLTAPEPGLTPKVPRCRAVRAGGRETACPTTTAAAATAAAIGSSTTHGGTGPAPPSGLLAPDAGSGRDRTATALPESAGGRRTRPLHPRPAEQRPRPLC